jgi:hypothetical protein
MSSRVNQSRVIRFDIYVGIPYKYEARNGNLSTTMLGPKQSTTPQRTSRDL